VQKLRQYAILAADGHVNENPGFRPGQPGGGRVMGDTTTIWLLELLEVYQHTGELTLIESLWPQVQRAAAWQIASTAEIGLPFKLVW
jgi:glycogen debranching enzyme